MHQICSPKSYPTYEVQFTANKLTQYTIIWISTNKTTSQNQKRGINSHPSQHSVRTWQNAFAISRDFQGGWREPSVQMLLMFCESCTLFIFMRLVDKAGSKVTAYKKATLCPMQCSWNMRITEGWKFSHFLYTKPCLLTMGIFYFWPDTPNSWQ